MDQGLIATIGAIVGGTIPLGALTFALIRWIDGRHRKDMAVLREEMRAGEGRLRDEVKATEGRLRDEMKATEARLDARIERTEGGLRAEMRATEKRLDARIGGLEDSVGEVTKGLVKVEGRLSRVEGVIEGALLINRTAVAESREGAA